MRSLGVGSFAPSNTTGSSAPPPPPSTDLLLYLDAANPESYPGSGNTWFDLSGNGNNASVDPSVSTSPTFQTGFGGYFLWNEFSDITFPGLAPATGDFSIICWFNTDTSVSGQYSFRDLAFSLGQSGQNGQLLFYVDNDSSRPRIYIQDGAILGSFRIRNTGWRMLSVIRQGSTFYGYIDTTLMGTKQGTFSLSSDFIVGRRTGGAGTFPARGARSVLQVYNKGLNATQLGEVFDSFQGRYITPTT